jgi:hypothetical protein
LLIDGGVERRIPSVGSRNGLADGGYRESGKGALQIGLRGLDEKRIRIAALGIRGPEPPVEVVAWVGGGAETDLLAIHEKAAAAGGLG